MNNRLLLIIICSVAIDADPNYNQDQYVKPSKKYFSFTNTYRPVQQPTDDNIYSSNDPSSHPYNILPPAPALYDPKPYVRQVFGQQNGNHGLVSPYSFTQNEVNSDYHTIHDNTNSNAPFNEEQASLYSAGRHKLAGGRLMKEMPGAVNAKTFKNDINKFSDDERHRAPNAIFKLENTKHLPENTNVYIQINDNIRSLDGSDENLRETPVDVNNPDEADMIKSANDMQAKRLLSMILNIKSYDNRNVFLSDWIHTYLTHPGFFDRPVKEQISSSKKRMAVLAVGDTEQNIVEAAFLTGLVNKTECRAENGTNKTTPLRVNGKFFENNSHAMDSHSMNVHNTTNGRGIAGSSEENPHSAYLGAVEYNPNKHLLSKSHDKLTSLFHLRYNSSGVPVQDGNQGRFSGSSSDNKMSQIHSDDTTKFSYIHSDGKNENGFKNIGQVASDNIPEIPADDKSNNKLDDKAVLNDQILHILHKSLAVLMHITKNQGSNGQSLRDGNQFSSDYSVENGCVCVK